MMRTSLVALAMMVVACSGGNATDSPGSGGTRNDGGAANVAGSAADGTAGSAADGTAGSAADGTAGSAADGTAGSAADGTAGSAPDGAAGSASGGTGGTSDVVVAADLMEALCDHMEDCCTAAEFLYDLSYDPSACMSGNIPSYLVDLATDYPEQAAICLEEIRRLACDQRLEGCEPPAEVGVIPLDGRCELSSQCAPHPEPDMVTRCDPETLRCVATPRETNLGLPCYDTCEGGECYGPTDPEDDRVACVRERGLYCDGEVCQPVISVGESCNEDSECVTGALCVDETCWGDQQVGDECRKTTRYSETIDTCAATSYCDDTNHCVAKKGIGEDCASNEECFSNRCLHDGICLAGLGVPECR